MIRSLHSPRFVAGLSYFVATMLAIAAPVAVNDSYTTNEDIGLQTGGGVLSSSDFEAGTNLLGSGNWLYLDKIKNDQAGQVPDGYPTDAGTRDWKTLDFDTASSTIGPWGSGPLPLVGGVLDGAASAPAVLTGVSVNNAPFTITTYLFRKTFTASASQAATADWTMRILIDDGAIFYLNGQEIHRENMNAANLIPAGPVTTLTGTANGNEATYVNVNLNLAGKLVAGTNVFAVEVHQGHGGGSWVSTDAGIDCTLTPGGGATSGFTYVDDTFGTNFPDNASGAHVPTGGFNSTGGLFADVGYRPGGFGGGSRPASGGWRRNFTTLGAGMLRFSGRYRLMTKGGCETNEWADFIMDVDGTRYGSQGTAPTLRIERLLGPNATNQGNNLQTDSGWKQFSQDVTVAAGAHTLTLGVHNNNTTADTEHVEIYLDDVVVELLSSGDPVLVNDTGGAVGAVLVSTTTHGALSLQANGGFLYIPDANYSGPDSFTYRASDGVETSNIATASITVNAVNDAPVGQPESYSTDRDVTLNVPAATGVLVNDTDVDTPKANLTAVLAAAPANGSVTLNPNGSFTYTPNALYAGADNFSYRVSDGSLQSALVSVNLSVVGVSPPTGVPDDYTMVRNTQLSVTATTTSTVTEDAVPYLSTNWRYLDNGSNQGTAWRAAGFDDSTWKTGAAELGYGDGDEATVVEDNPTPGYVASDTDRFATTYFRKAFTVTDLHRVTGVEVTLRYDDGGVVYINGTRVLATDGVPVDPAFDLFVGSNNENATQSANLTIPASALVEGTNVVAVEIHQQQAGSSDITMDVRVRLTKTVYGGVLANDTDLEGDSLTANLVAGPVGGTFNFSANGTFNYTPPAGFTGDKTFTYRANDGNENSAVTTATIHVITGPNQPPIVAADSYPATEENQLTVIAPGVLSNDTDGEGDSFTAELVTGISPAGAGALSLNANGSFTFTPALNFAGPATFTYRARDAGNGVSTPATVTINVANVNDAPVAANDNFSTDPGVALNVPAPGILSNDTDADGNSLTAAIVAGVTPAAAGSLTLNPDGSLNFVPAVGFTGTATFTYRANDGTVNSATAATVSLKINSRPVANNDSYNGTEDSPLTINAPGLLVNDTDPENDSLTAVIATPPSPAQGSVTVNPNGSFTFTPAANFNGAATFAYKANDGIRDSLNSATVTINVAPTNDAPSANADTYGTPLNTPLVVPAPGVLANDTDLENNSLTAVLAVGPTSGSLTFNANGSFSYTPVAGFSGQVSFTYRASDGTAASTPTMVTLNVGVVPTNVVINEIMFHPVSDADGEEYIELYNKGPIPVDLAGWQFTAGVNFTFPSITIPAGGYLVVAANPATFGATYGGVPLLTGPWTGSLANGGETIRLQYPDSTAADGLSEADQVDYSDEGDWGLRRVFNDTESGWDWQSRADGFGDSIQLINPALENNNGQNWTKRETGAAGNQRTPGQANTDLAANPSLNVAPLITAVQHSPAIPRTTDPVVVTARLTDEVTTGLTAHVFWRTWTPNQSTAGGAFADLVMADNGLSGDGLANDGVFGATIPAQAVANTIVEFYVQGIDNGARSRTWPAPTTNGGAQGANCNYQVDENPITGRHPAYRFIATGGDQYQFDQSRWDSNSNAGINITFISTQGSDTDIRYQCTLRVRGAGSRGLNPKNWKLSFPGDDDFNGQTQANVNVRYSYLQFIGAQLMKGANLPHEGATPVHVRLNGTNPSPGGASTGYGMYVHMQPIGDPSYDNENFSHDRGGNVYKRGRGAASASTLPYRDAGGGLPNITAYINDGWSKQSNTGENNWNDLHQLHFQLNKAGGYTMADLEGVMDIDQWARALAFTTIVNDAETNFSNGSADDFGLYFGVVDPRAILLMHDYDTILGLGDSGTNTGDGIYQVIATTGSSHLSNSETLPIMAGFYQNPIINQRYKAQLADLLNTVFLPANFDAFVDAELGDWPNMPASVRTGFKTYNAARRTAILGMINGGSFTATTNLTVQSGYPRTTSATNTGLSGNTDPVSVRKVLVNGISVAVNNYNSGANGAGTWSAGTAVTLQPGLNNVVVQALGTGDAVLATQTFTIWYDDTSVVDVASISGNANWTAAGGPYRVTASLNIDNETLSIAPGTTVYFASGGGFNVTGTGRVLAEGNADAHIRFALEPGTAGPWGGITLTGATQESRFAYVDIDNAGNAPVISLNNSVGFFSHIGWSNLDEQYFGSTNSSFIFEDSTWPSDTNVSYVNVNGIPASGYAIFRRNTFGVLNGTQNILTITGGKRPGGIIQILDNTFTGATDDAIELFGADAHIEGNAFLNAHQVISGADSANAIAITRSGAVISEATIVRNLFYNCDHAVLSTGGSIPTVVNNTVVNINNTGSATGSSASAFNFNEPGRAGIVAGGAGRFDGNIVVDCPLVFGNAASATGALTANLNMLPAAISAPVTGSGNLTADPLLTATTGITAANIRTSFAISSGSPARGTGPNALDRGGMVPAGASIGGVPYTVTPANFATLTIGGPGITHYKYAVDGGLYTTNETPIATPISLASLTQGPHYVSVIGKNSANVWQDVLSATLSRTWTVSTGAQPVIVNEILVVNVDAHINGTTRPDYIELRNLSASPLTLNNWRINDSPITPTNLGYPLDGVVIPANGYLLLYADSATSSPGVHTGFGLDADGEGVYLYNGGVLVDSILFGPQITDRSIGRLEPDFAWSLNAPTPGTANSPTALGSPSQLRINEWLGTNDFIIADDFVELYNPNSLPVSLAGLSLTNDPNDIDGNRIAPLAYIPAGGFVRFIADGNADQGPSHLAWGLSKYRELIQLHDNNGALIDYVVSGPQSEDVSEGRATDGGGSFTFFTLPTPGYSNTTNLTAQTNIMNNLRITELMYAPNGGTTAPEFVELQNISAALTLDLTGVRFNNGIDYEFPAGTTLAPGQYIVLTSNGPAFFTRYGFNAFGGFSGRLDNSGERLRLEIGGFELGIHDFNYSSAWYPSTAGAGASLQIVDPLAPRNTWDEKVRWTASTTPTPGSTPIFGVNAGADQAVQPGVSANLLGSITYASVNPANVTVLWQKISGPGTVNFTSPAALNTAASFSLTGIYVLRITATDNSAGGEAVLDDVTIYASETYASWATRTISNPALRGETQDPDNDGIINLLEFGFGLNPVTPSTTLIQYGFEPGFFTITYRRDLNAGGVTFSVLKSTLLPSWSIAGETEEVLSTTGSVQNVKARVPNTGIPSMFLRVLITSF